MADSLSALELASGIVTGGDPPLRLARTSATPAERLRAATLPALRGGPCLISFSGGIDSSLVLSAATQAARRNGLPDPIPISWRFIGAPAAAESDWQERIVAELRLRDWVRRVAEPGELDLVGPVAREVINRHGLLHPANAFLHVPLLQVAAPGTLLTGIGGDQVLGLWRWRGAAAVLRGETPVRPRSAAGVALSRAPAAVRARLERRRTQVSSPWLWPAAERAIVSARAREVAAEPPSWPARVAWQATRRNLTLGLRSLELLASEAGTGISHPLLDPGFLSALAAAGGRHGVGSRAATITALLSEVMPAALTQRRSKALFDEVFWQEPARALMGRWDSEAVDGRLVNAEALRAHWRGATVDARTAHLLQQVWLADQSSASPSSRSSEAASDDQRRSRTRS